ncbi:hypothetical protein KAR52_03315 [Candidatus Pacearchaeota archaeon]|nr:hypothetical protein [Candidatus Pacearchaeota archaeon]
MVEETILQHWILTRFAFPFLLMFFIVFAILEKTKLLGEGKKQLNALLSFVVALVFVSAIYPTVVVNNMILFLTVGLVVLFVALLLWGFIFGDKEGFKIQGWIKGVLGGLVGVAMIIAVLWATGVQGKVIEFLFRQEWSNTFWINAVFIAVIAIALALVLKKPKK